MLDLSLEDRAATLNARYRNHAAVQVLRHALGIAEYHGPRSQMMREIDNPTMLHDGSGMGALVGVNAALLASGAPIDRINLVRKHLSRVKGGQLAAAAWPARDLLGLKWVAVTPSNADRGRPVIDGLVLLSAPDGSTRATLAAAELTALRTAAVTGGPPGAGARPAGEAGGWHADVLVPGAPAGVVEHGQRQVGAGQCLHLDLAALLRGQQRRHVRQAASGQHRRRHHRGRLPQRCRGRRERARAPGARAGVRRSRPHPRARAR